MESADLDALFAVMWQSRVVSYSWCSATALLWYDVLITLPVEVRRRQCSLVVHALSTISIPADNPHMENELVTPEDTILVYKILESVHNYVILIPQASVLALRLHLGHSFSDTSERQCTEESPAHFIIQCYVLVVVGKSSAETAFLTTPALPILGCLTNPSLHMTLASWITAITLAAIYFFMMLFKFWQSVNVARSAGTRIKISPLMQAFVRDGTIYFLMIVLVLISGALSSFLASGPLLSVYIPWNIAVYVIAVWIATVFTALMKQTDP
ncbi:hypothetical protein CVT25_008753 [Psilocybe cyanescens]|uniref:Uncharacterized protein n=1 Tax=Psilocybe cyanescens TaxID=93625 RepID=A0A409XNN5_PSICY|nr:hypothetical protein CVT25_008753 [Psilocybe cyanescens]